MKTNQDLKKDYPYLIDLIGCDVHIMNGLSGHFQVDAQALVVDSCKEGLSVLCDSSDITEYVTVLDLSKGSTGFAFKVTSLYPADFGFTTKSELIEHLSAIADKEVLSKCCIDQSNEMAVQDIKSVPTPYFNLSYPNDVLGEVVLPFDVYSLVYNDGVNPSVITSYSSPITINSFRDFINLWNSSLGSFLRLSAKDFESIWIDVINPLATSNSIGFTGQAAALPIREYGQLTWKTGDKLTL